MPESSGAFYIGKRRDGSWTVRRGRSSRASHIADTQTSAIAWVAARYPRALIHVDRVNQTGGGARETMEAPDNFDR
jgi:hypothetical protein